MANDVVTNQFSDLGEIATRQGFIFPPSWYRVVLGVQIKNTSAVVRGSDEKGWVRLSEFLRLCLRHRYGLPARFLSLTHQLHASAFGRGLHGP